jgi:hypothetical protein
MCDFLPRWSDDTVPEAPIATDRLIAVFVRVRSVREQLLAVIVPETKGRLQGQQTVVFFLRLCPVSILRMQPSFLTRLSYRSTVVLPSEATNSTII